MSEDKHHADFTNFKSNLNKEEVLQQLIDSYSALSFEQTNWVCNLSNASSLLWHAYHSLNIPVNWSGFYLLDKETDGSTLILGPFQGKVACQTIKLGKGVCGVSGATKTTQIVKDVNNFPGHIACDGETKSEIVVSIVSKEGNLIGVLDIDCLDYKGFDEIDGKYLEQLCNLITTTCKF